MKINKKITLSPQLTQLCNMKRPKGKLTQREVENPVAIAASYKNANQQLAYKQITALNKIESQKQEIAHLKSPSHILPTAIANLIGYGCVGFGYAMMFTFLALTVTFSNDSIEQMVNATFNNN